MYTSADIGDAERSLASYLEQEKRPSLSLSPVDRPFTSHVHAAALGCQTTGSHDTTDAVQPPPTHPQPGRLGGRNPEADVHGLYPPRLDLIEALYQHPRPRPCGADDAVSTALLTNTPSDDLVLTPQEQQQWLRQQAVDHREHSSSSEAAPMPALPSVVRLRAFASFGADPALVSDGVNTSFAQSHAPTYGQPRSPLPGGPHSATASHPLASSAPEADATAAASLSVMCHTLPWWKVILLRPDYRKRLCELATSFYRAEMKVLAQMPERISSADGKERLTGTVMSQYVALPPRAVWSVRHPHSFIQRSTLETLRMVALYAMPPTMSSQEKMQQVAAVEHHIRTQRRLSTLKTPAMKRCDQQDLLHGRVPLPDPFDSEAEHILERNAAVLAGPPPVVTVGAQALQEAIGSPLSHSAVRDELERALSSGVGAAGAEATYGFGESVQSRRSREKAAQLELYHFPTPPPSPRSRLRGLGKGGTVEESKVTPYGTLVRSPSRRAAQEMKDARVEAQHARDAALSAASPGGGLQLSPEEYARRLAEEALSRFDGTNNLYGLSYFWDAPFPPAGFIREVPEPRQAMWPDDVRDEAKRAEEVRKRREAEALVDRVNERAKKLAYCRRYGLRANMAKLLKEEEVDLEAQRALEDGAKGMNNNNNNNRKEKNKTQHAQHDGLTDEQRQLSEPKPLYDGALHINIVQPGAYGEVRGRTSVEEPAARLKRSPTTTTTATATAAATTTTSQFLGTFRQSLLLIHFKIFCCALREEQRLRRGGTAAHVSAVPIADRLAVHGEKPTASECADEKLLSGVPCIPTPVLRVQRASPTLAKPGLRHTVRLDEAQDAVCWEGLIPSLPQDPTHPAVHVWRYLHQASFAARQSLRDIFNSLDHDADGRLVKQTFVEFVLDLLHLFFPTHLADVHVAIAEEEWIYRGTAENVGFDVFFEKFFSLPFTFHRRIAEVTEDDYIEFWSLVRICLFESAETAPVLLSFEKTLMVPATASDVAVALAGTLTRCGTSHTSSHVASPLSDASRRNGGGGGSADGDDVFVETAGSPMRITKITGTCTASAAQKMKLEEKKNMSRILGTNTSLSCLAGAVQQQQEQQQQHQDQENGESTVGVDVSASRLKGPQKSSSVSAANNASRAPADASVMSKAESMVALMKKERTALKGVQAASTRYAAAVADGFDKNGTILMSAVFRQPGDDDGGGGSGAGSLDEDEEEEETPWSPTAAGQQRSGGGGGHKKPPRLDPRLHGLRQRRRLSLLGPIMGFTPAQVTQLYKADYEHEEDYPLYHALSEVLQKDPVVRLLPPSRQYGVALSRSHKLVQERLAVLRAAHDVQEAEAIALAKAARNRRDVGRDNSIGVDELGDGLLRGAEGAGLQADLRAALQRQKDQQRERERAADAAAWEQAHVRDAQSQTGVAVATGTTRPIGTGNRLKRVAEAAQLRRAVLHQLEEDRRLAQLLQNSQRYQDSKRRRQARFNTALAKVESTASSWELHVDGVYDVREPEASVEDRLLHYLRDVSPDVFDSHVSLRERFLVHERFIEERRRLGREKSGLVLSPGAGSAGGAPAAAAVGAVTPANVSTTGFTGPATMGSVIVGPSASFCAAVTPLSTFNGTATTAAVRSTTATTSGAVGILGQGYGDTVVLRAPPEAKTVAERLQRMEHVPTVEELYLASMDAHHGTSASVSVSAAGAGETARATFVSEASTDAPSRPESRRRLLGRRHSSRQFTSYAAGAYPVRPERVSCVVYDEGENGITTTTTTAGGGGVVNKNGTIDRQALIDELLRVSLLGPDGLEGSTDDKTQNNNNDSHENSFTTTASRSRPNNRAGRRQPRGSLGSFLTNAAGATVVLDSPHASEMGSSSSDASDAHGAPQSARHAAAVAADGPSLVKRIPSSRSLPSAARATDRATAAQKVTSDQALSGGRATLRKRLQQEMDEGRAALQLLGGGGGGGGDAAGTSHARSLSSSSLSSSSSRSVSFRQDGGESASPTIPRSGRTVRFGGVPAAGTEQLSPRPAPVKSLPCASPSSSAVAAPLSARLPQVLTVSHSGSMGTPDRGQAHTAAQPEQEEEETLVAPRLERHTQNILDGLSGSLLLPRQTRRERATPATTAESPDGRDTAATATSSGAYGSQTPSAPYVLEPHRPPFAGTHTTTTATVLPPPPPRSSRPHAVPSHAAREAMAAAARVLGAGDAARMYEDHFERTSASTSARNNEAAAEAPPGGYGACASSSAAARSRDVDLARRLASQRAREERWVRQQEAQVATRSGRTRRGK